MDRNNNQRFPTKQVNRQSPMPGKNTQSTPVRSNTTNRKGAAQNPQRRNYQRPPERRVSPEQRRARIAAEKAARQSKLEKVSVFALLVLILLSVIIVARACRGDVSAREKYVIEETTPVAAADVADEEPKLDLLVPTADSSTRELDAQIESQYGVMISRSDGHIVASREADTRVYPASLTKVMTLIVAVENSVNLDETVTFTSDMITPFYEAGASLVGFAEGETVNLRDLLYGMILLSGADATEGVVRITAGDEESFVAMMNDKAKELNLTDTHFVNAVGLHDDDHYSTCNELAIILDYALENEICREILSTYQYTTSATDQNPDGIALTSNLQSRMEGGESEVARIYGGKTGYTDAAGNCLASYAQAYSDGEEYIIITCKGASLYTPIFDHINICKIYLAEEDTDESVSEAD